MIKKHLESRFQTLLCKLILTQSSSKRQFITVRVPGLRLHSSMFYTTSKMSDMEVHHIFCISFLYRDSKWIERVKSECHQPLSCWWNWATQETSMDLKFQKPWIPRIKPAKERNISNTNFARFKFTINRKKVLNCNFLQSCVHWNLMKTLLALYTPRSLWNWKFAPQLRASHDLNGWCNSDRVRRNKISITPMGEKGEFPISVVLFYALRMSNV